MLLFIFYLLSPPLVEPEVFQGKDFALTIFLIPVDEQMSKDPEH
jgi:hypothetical protein